MGALVGEGLGGSSMTNLGTFWKKVMSHFRYESDEHV